MFCLAGLIEPYLESDFMGFIVEYFESLKPFWDTTADKEWQCCLTVWPQNLYCRRDRICSIIFFGQQHWITLTLPLFWCTQQQQSGTFLNCTAPSLFFRVALKMPAPQQSKKYTSLIEFHFRGDTDRDIGGILFLPNLLSSFLSHFFASVLKVIHLAAKSKSMARPGRLGLNVSSNMWGVKGQPCFIINSRPMCSQGGKAGCQGNELI